MSKDNSVSVDINIPWAKRNILTPKMMLTSGLDTIVLIRRRTTNGIDANGNQFHNYSTTPTYISKKAFPRPRGGVAKPKTIYYQGGYRQYKKESRQPGTVGTRRNTKASKPTAEVDLTRTGLMLNSLKVVDYYAQGFTIKVTGQASSYATHVDNLRHFLGLTKDDRAKLVKLISAQVLRRLS